MVALLMQKGLAECKEERDKLAQLFLMDERCCRM